MVVRDARDVERGQWQPAARGWAVSRKASVRAGAAVLVAARVRDVAAMLPRLITGRDEDGMRWHRAQGNLLLWQRRPCTTTRVPCSTLLRPAQPSPPKIARPPAAVARGRE